MVYLNKPWFHITSGASFLSTSQLGTLPLAIMTQNVTIYILWKCIWQNYLMYITKCGPKSAIFIYLKIIIPFSLKRTRGCCSYHSKYCISIIIIIMATSDIYVKIYLPLLWLEHILRGITACTFCEFSSLKDLRRWGTSSSRKMTLWKALHLTL